MTMINKDNKSCQIHYVLQPIKMVFRIVIAGESQCEMFAQACLVADCLAKNLPEFCFERIEKSVVDWKFWLSKINQRFNWHHLESPIIWKELLMKGSKPFLIGTAQDFWDYCYSYYNFETFLSCDMLDNLVKNQTQFKKKIQNEGQRLAEIERQSQSKQLENTTSLQMPETSKKKNFVICIAGARHPLVMDLVSGLLELSVGDKNISKIFICDPDCSQSFTDYVEQECSYVESESPSRVVRMIDKIGLALTQTDILIIMDHIPLGKMGIGDWLQANRRLMKDFSYWISASACSAMRIIFPNLGPACYNATILSEAISSRIDVNNVVVATSDIALEVAPIIADIAKVPMRYLYCTPIWGFVGVNHLVDVNNTVHKYCAFDPFKRYVKVNDSTLTLGTITPQMRIMDYLMHWDETLWTRVLKARKMRCQPLHLNKAVAVLNLLKLWLFDKQPGNVVTLGIRCNGSFGLQFEGVFSQPARFENGQWVPAADYMLPKDLYVKLNHLEDMAKMCMTLGNGDIPRINRYVCCICKPKNSERKMKGERNVQEDKYLYSLAANRQPQNNISENAISVSERLLNDDAASEAARHITSAR